MNLSQALSNLDPCLQQYRVLPPVLSVDISAKLDQTFNNIDPPETFGCRNLWREPETDLSPGASGL